MCHSMHVWISLLCLKKQNIECQIVGYQYILEHSGGETLVILVLIALLGFSLRHKSALPVQKCILCQ